MYALLTLCVKSSVENNRDVTTLPYVCRREVMDYMGVKRFIDSLSKASNESVEESIIQAFRDHRDALADVFNRMEIVVLPE